MTRGIHTKPNRGESVDWLTPPDILERLGPFDLDPCASTSQVERGELHARVMVCPPADGLRDVEWSGRVWLNPPYGPEQVEFMRRLAEHDHGTALVASRTEVERWFVPFVWEAATAVLFPYGRLYYYRPDGTKASGNAGHGSCFAAYGHEDAAKLLSSGIRGKFLMLK